MKKKIIQLTTVHPSLDTRIFQRYAVATSENENFESILINLNDDNFFFKNVKFISTGSKKNLFYRIFFSQIKIFKKIIQLNPNIVHFHDPELIFLGFFLKLKKIKVIYDVHENYEEKLRSKKGIFYFFVKLIAPKIYHFLRKLFFVKFDAITCASLKIKDKYEKYNNYVLNIENFSMFDFLEKEKILRKKKFNKMKVIYTGGLTHYRGAEQIINLFDVYKPKKCELILCGRSDHLDLKKKLKEKLRNPNISNYGNLKIEDVYKLMTDASVGVLLNQNIYDYNNAVPNKFFEYMSMGLPILASNFGYWDKIIKDLKIGETCDSSNLESIYKSFNKIINNYDFYIENYLKNSSLIQKKFTWSSKKKRLINFYNYILKKDD